MAFDLTGRRVFVAGHAGMVGSAIVRRLVSEDVTLLTASRAELDLTDPGAVERWFAANRPEVVYLAAAKVGGIHANNSLPVDFLESNLVIQLNVIGAAHRHDVAKLLFLGSSCIYPKFAPQPIPESALLSGPLEPTNQWYAIAKIAGIMQCQAYRRQYGCDFIAAQPTNLYGPGDNFDLATSHVLPALIRKALEARDTGAESLTIWGSGTPFREFLHVDDLADALVFLTRHYSADEHINVGSGQEVTIRDLALKIADVTGFTGRLEFDASKPDGTPRKLIDSTRLNQLGWQPQVTLDAGIRSTVDWYLAHQHDGSVRGRMTGADARPAGDSGDGRTVHIINRYYHPDLSATAQIATDVGAELARRGWRVVAHACPWRYEGDAARLAATETASGVTIRRLRTTGFGRSSGFGRLIDYATFHLAVAARLLLSLRRGDIIICKTDPPMLSVTVGAVAALRGARVINWLQDLFPEVADALLPGPVTGLLKALRNWSLRRASANVVIGDIMRDRLMAAGVDAATIRLIPNWADPAITPINRRDIGLRAQWGLADDVTTVAYSGNLGFAHDHATMLGAARALRERHDILFLMIGGGAGMKMLEQAVASESLGNIRFLPYQPRETLSLSLGAGDIHWLSLRPDMEGLIVPSKLYGIVSAGRPFLFVGDAGGEVARFIDRHGGGAVVAEGDSNAFAAQIADWADNPDARMAVGEQAAAAAALYSRDSAFAAWDAIVRAVGDAEPISGPA